MKLHNRNLLDCIEKLQNNDDFRVEKKFANHREKTSVIICIIFHLKLLFPYPVYRIVFSQVFVSVVKKFVCRVFPSHLIISKFQPQKTQPKKK